LTVFLGTFNIVLSETWKNFAVGVFVYLRNNQLTENNI